MLDTWKLQNTEVSQVYSYRAIILQADQKVTMSFLPRYTSQCSSPSAKLASSTGCCYRRQAALSVLIAVVGKNNYMYVALYIYNDHDIPHYIQCLFWDCNLMGGLTVPNSIGLLPNNGLPGKLVNIIILCKLLPLRWYDYFIRIDDYSMFIAAAALGLPKLN